MMNLTELYTKIGGNIEELLARFGNESRVKRFLKLFLKDPSFDELQIALKENDWETAFRAAHTLKGVTANMCLSRLHDSVFRLTEALRGKEALQDYGLYDAVCEDFTYTTRAVREYLDANP